VDEGQDDYFFHATEDRQETRDWFFTALKNLDFDVDTIIAQKNKTNPSLYTHLELSGGKFKTIRSEERFYDKVSQMLLQYIFRRYEEKDGIEKIVVVLGSIFTGKKRGYVLKSLKQYLKQSFKKPFYVYFHPTASDINCQIADYCGWAAYVRAERGEERPWAEIKDKVKSCFDVFRTGRRPSMITNRRYRNDQPAYPFREEPEGSCWRVGTFTPIIHEWWSPTIVWDNAIMKPSMNKEFIEQQKTLVLQRLER